MWRATGPAGPFARWHRFYAPVAGGFPNAGTTVYQDAAASPAYGQTFTYLVAIVDATGASAYSAGTPAAPLWSGWHRFRGDATLSGRSPAFLPEKLVPAWVSPAQAYALRGQVQDQGWVYPCQDGTGTKGGLLSAYNAFTGAAGPAVAPTNWSVAASPLVGPDGTLYAGMQDSNAKTDLWALATPGLGVKWGYQMATANGFEGVKLNLAFMGNGEIFMGNDYGDVRGIIPAPATAWLFPEAISSQAGGAAVLLNGNVAYAVKRTAANVMCLTPDGGVAWTQTLAGAPSGTPYASPLAVRPDGQVLVAAAGLNLLDAGSGVVLWSVPLSPAANGLAVDLDGTAYLSRGSVVSAVGPAGALLWTVTVSGGAATETAPPVLTANGRLVVPYKVGTTDDGVQLLRAADGAPLWDWRGGVPTVFANNLTSAAMTPDGWTYVSGDNLTWGFGPPPVLLLHERVDVPQACAGSQVTYTLSWSNATAMTAVGFAVYDTLPVGALYRAPSLAVQVPPAVVVTAQYAAALGGPYLAGEPPDGTPGPLVLRWQISSVGRYASGALSFALGVSATIQGGGLLLNAASGTWYDGSATMLVQSETAVTTIFQEPSAPLALTAVSFGPREVVLAWSPPSSGGSLGVTGYHVYRATGPAGPFEPAWTTTGAGATVFLDTPVSNGVTYHYAVAARDACGLDGPLSTTVMAVPAEPPAPYVIAWTALPSLNVARYAHELVPAGRTLYALGGDTGTGVTASLEASAPSSGNPAWTALSPTGTFTARRSFGAVERNGEVYAAGGTDGTARVDTMQKLTPGTTGWSDVATTGFTSMESFPLRLDPATKYFTAFGGTGSGGRSSLIQLFDPSASSWANAPWLVPARRNAGAAPSSLSLFVYGGDDSVTGPSQVTQELLFWKAELDQRASLPAPGREGVASAALGYRPYAIGGDNGAAALQDVLEYSPAADAWKARAPLPTPRTDARVAQQDGRLYLTGGRSGPVAGFTVLADVLRGDPLKATPGSYQAGLAWGVDPGTYPLAPYVLYRSTYVITDVTTAVPLNPAVPAAASTYTDNGVTNGNFYMYLLEAADVKGNASWLFDVAVLPATAPSGLTARAGSAQVALSWARIPQEQPENVIGYCLWRSTVAAPFDQAVYAFQRCLGPGVTSYTDTGLVNGTTYYYAVTALSSQTGHGAASNLGWATPFAIAPPGAPGMPAVTAGRDQINLLTWAASTPGGRPVSGYLVFRTTQPSGSPVTSGDLIGVVVLPASPVYLDQYAPATFGASYRYAVVAFDDWSPATPSAESPASAAAAPPAGFWRMGRGDALGTAASLRAGGLTTALGLRWSFPTGGTVWCAPAVESAGATVFFTSGDGFLYGVSEAGSLVFKTPLPFGEAGTESSPLITYADAAGTVDRVVVGAAGGGGGHLDTFGGDGTPAWSAAMTGPVRASPAVHASGLILAADDAGTVRGFRRDGTVLWSVTVPGPVRGQILATPDVVVVMAGAALYGIKPFTGALTGSIALSSAPVGAIFDVPRRRLYVALAAGRLEGYDASGIPSLLWSYTIGGGPAGAPALDVANDRFVVASTDGRGYAVNVATGAPPASAALSAPSRGAVAVALNGRRYAGADDGRMNELDAAGNLLSTAPLPGVAAFGTAQTVLWQTASGRTVVTAGSAGWRVGAFVDAPGAPAALTAAAAPGEIRLAWVPAAAGFFAVSAYRVWRSTCGGCAFGQLATLNGAATAFTDCTVTPYGAFTYRVDALDASPFNNPGPVSAAVAVGATGLVTPVLAVAVSQTPAAPNTGDAVTYRIVVANAGASTIGAMMLTDTLSPAVVSPAALGPPAFGSATVTQAAGGTLFTWSDGALAFAPGQALTFTVTGFVAAVCAPVAAGCTAFGTALAVNSCGLPQGTAAAGSSTGFTIPAPVVSFTVSSTRTPAAPVAGTLVTYTFIATNTGTATATTLQVTDTLPAGEIFSSESNSAGLAHASAGQVHGWSGAVTLAPGASATVTVSATVTCTGAPQSSTAFVLAGSACGSAQAVGGLDTFTPTVPVPQVDVGVALAPASPVTGGPVTYRIVATNTGSATLTQFDLADTLAAVVVNVAASEPAGFGAPALTSIPGSGTLYAWSTSGLSFAPGATYTFTLTGQAGAVCSAVPVSASAYAVGYGGCGSATRLAAGPVFTLAGLAPGMALSQSRTPVTPSTGSGVTYTFIATNTGTATATNLTVTETLAAGLVLSSESNTAGLVHAAAGQVQSWSGAVTVAPGASATVTLNATVTCTGAPQSSTAFALAGSACGSAQATSGLDSFTPTLIMGGVSLAISLTPVTPSTGSGVTYRLDVTNTGASTIMQLDLLDTVASGVVVAGTAQPAGFGAPVATGVAGGTRYEWAAAGLTFSPGAIYTFTLTGQAGAVCAATPVTSSAYVIGFDACGWVTALKAGPVFVLYPASAGVAVSQVQTPSSGSSLAAGSGVTYRIVVSNTGTATIQQLTLVETVAAAVVGGGTAQPAGFAAPLVTATASGSRYEWSAAGLTLAPGAALTFTATGAAGVTGVATAVSATAVVSAADACGAVEAQGNPVGAVILPAVTLAAGLSPVPATVSVGQAFPVTLTVTDTGAAAASNVTAALWLSGGSGAATIAGPSPASAGSLAAGTGVAFTFTLTATMPGAATWTATATAGGGAVSNPSSAGPVSIVPAASLSATAADLPGTVCAGASFLYVLTVTNAAGSAAALAVVPGPLALGGTSVGTSAAGPAPATGNVAGGASLAFTWTVTAGSAGTVVATASVTGRDANGGWNTGAAAGPQTATAAAAAALAVTINAPPAGTLVRGSANTLVVTVTNTGGAAATGVAVVLGLTSGGGTLTGAPPAQTVAGGGGSAGYAFTFTPPATGSYAFSASATGSGCGPVNAAAVASFTAVPSPGALSVVSLALSPAGGVLLGGVATATLTLTNTGDLGATVYAPGLTTAAAPAAAAAGPSVPVPALPRWIAGHAAASFAWTYTAAACGSLAAAAAPSGTAATAAGSAGFALARTTSNTVAITGAPARIAGGAAPASARVGDQVTIAFQVWDACGNPAAGRDLTLAVVAPADAVLGASGVRTGADGVARTTLRLGSAKGSNLVRADLRAVPGLFGTVTVTGTVPEETVLYLSRNFFDPARAERLRTSCYVPAASRVAVRVYDLAGELVRKVGDAEVPAGLAAWEWDGRNDAGGLVGNGTYFVQATAGGVTRIRRVIVLKE